MGYKIKQLLFVSDKNISAHVLSLGLPVIASNLSRTIMNMADVAMVGRLGAPSLAATGMGSMLVWVALSFAIGLRTGTQTVSSRRLGQKIYKECGTAMHNGHLLALLLAGPITAAGYYFSPVFVPWFISDSVVTPLCVDYTSIASLSVFFSSIGFVYQGFFTGIEKPQIHLKVTVVSNLLNIYLNAGLIYGQDGITDILSRFNISWLGWAWGWWSFPALGVKGAAIATLIASVWLMLHYTFYLFRDDIKDRFSVMKWTFNRAMLRKQVSLAVPQGSQEIIVTLGYAVFLKIVGLISIVSLAATEVVFTILHAAFMPGAGIGQACATLVGKFLGEGDEKKAETSIVESVRLSFIIMGTMGLLFLLIPGWIIPLFTNDIEVIKTGITALRIAGFVEMADAIGLTLWFALSGAGNTKYPAIIESTTMWGLCLPLSYFSGVYLDWGFIGPWLAFGLNIVLFAALMARKVLQGDWKDIEV